MENATDIAPVKEGVTLVQYKLKNILSQKGLKVMESVGNPFDPELQEAITNIPATSEEWKGKEMDEMEKARNFIAHNRMLLPSEFQRLYMYIADWNRVIGL